MSRFSRLLLLAALAVPLSARAAEPAPAVAFGPKGVGLADASGKNTLTFGLRLQPRFVATLDGDPTAPDADAVSDVGFRLRRALLLAEGSVAGRLRFRLRVDAARAQRVVDGDGRDRLLARPVLDDAQAVYVVAEPLEIAVGQFKVAYTAQEAISDTALAFPERALPGEGLTAGDVDVDGFSRARDVGVQVQGRAAGRRLEWQVGAFNGDGANAWPPADTGGLYAARVQVAPLGELAYDELDLARGKPRVALGVSGNVDHHPRFDAAGAADGSEDDVRVGGELRFAAAGFAMNAEGYWGTARAPDVDPTERLGGYAQASYLLPVGVAPAVRVAALDPDRAASGDAVRTVEAAVNVLLPDPARPGATLGHNAKVQAAWQTAWREGASDPVVHQGTVGAVLGF